MGGHGLFRKMRGWVCLLPTAQSGTEQQVGIMFAGACSSRRNRQVRLLHKPWSSCGTCASPQAPHPPLVPDSRRIQTSRVHFLAQVIWNQEGEVPGEQ